MMMRICRVKIKRRHIIVISIRYICDLTHDLGQHHVHVDIHITFYEELSLAFMFLLFFFSLSLLSFFFHPLFPIVRLHRKVSGEGNYARI